MRITGSMDIAASPEIVWSYLVEPEKAKQWFTNIKVYDWTSEENDVVGSTFYWEEEAAGKTYKLHFVTTGWEPFKEFSFKMTSGDFFKSWRLGRLSELILGVVLVLMTGLNFLMG